jgi:hypothetical protein
MLTRGDSYTSAKERVICFPEKKNKGLVLLNDALESVAVVNYNDASTL